MNDSHPRSEVAATGTTAAPETTEAGVAAPVESTFEYTAQEPAATAEVAQDPQTYPVPQRPADDQPTDKLWVHFAWEGLLLVVVALGVAGFILFWPTGRLDDVDAAAGLLVGTAPFLLLAMAVGLSMRVGAVNLAVAHLAFLSMVIVSRMGDVPLLHSIAMVAGVMVVAGVAMALLVTVFKAPGWAASLGVAMVAWFMASNRDLGVGNALGMIKSPTHLPSLETVVAWSVVAAVVVLSIGGGLIGMIRPLRNTMGTCVDVAERRGRQTAGSFFLTWGALIGSSLLAGAAGYLAMFSSGGSLLGVFNVNPNGPTSLMTAVGIVLIGGTAARGRRGGVFGTVLAAVILFMVAISVDGNGGHWVSSYAVPFGALMLGLLVNWGLDLSNRPRKNRAAALAVPAPLAMAGSPIAVEPVDANPVYIPIGTDSQIAAEPASPYAADAAYSETYAESSPLRPPPFAATPEHIGYRQPIEPVVQPEAAPAEPAAQTEPVEQAQPTQPAEPVAQPVERPVEPAPEAVAVEQTTHETPFTEFQAPPETANGNSAPDPTVQDGPTADDGDSTQEIPPNANPFLYRPPAG